MPVLAFAHSGRMPGGLILSIIVGWPAIFSGVHCLVVLLMHWKNLFRTSWLVTISKLITVLTSVLLAVSIFIYTMTLIDTLMGSNDYYSEHSWQLLVLLLLIVANFRMIKWAFKIPRKQYVELVGNKEES